MARAKVLVWVGAIVLGAVTVTLAEDSVSVGTTADIFSKYVWRGQNLVNNWVLQPGASVGYKGFTGSVWSNMDLTGETVAEGTFNEVDFTLDYSNKIPDCNVLGYSVGVIHYDFVNTDFHATTEAYAGLTASVPLSPGVRWFYDFNQIRGHYIQFSLGHTIEKVQRWADDCYCDVQLGASLGLGSAGYNEGYFGVNQTALNDLTLTAGVPFVFGKLIVKPSVAYSTMLSNDIRAGRTHNDNFWGGVGFAYSF